MIRSTPNARWACCTPRCRLNVHFWTMSISMATCEGAVRLHMAMTGLYRYSQSVYNLFRLSYSFMGTINRLLSDKSDKGACLACKYAAAYARPAQVTKSSCIVPARAVGTRISRHASRVSSRSGRRSDLTVGIVPDSTSNCFYAPEQTLADTHASIRLASKIACTTSQVEPEGKYTICTSYRHSLCGPVTRHRLKSHPWEAGLSSRLWTNRRKP